MILSQKTADMARFRVETAGGINETSVETPPGVTVPTGKNATNRTSLLQAIMMAMGSDQATLKGDADDGRTQFEFGDETYERTLIRTDGPAQFSGDSYLEDPKVADLFAFLLEINEGRQAVEAFHEHMDAVLDYENFDRIWIERIEKTVQEGRQRADRTVFELHVVRSTRNCTAYDDTIDQLSESEREVTGLVFALAGYLVHDLHETVPFLVLYSLEAVDSDSIAALVDYFAESADYLVVALLEKDAQDLNDDYHRVTDI